MRLAFPGLMAALSERVTIVTPTPALASVAVEQFSRAQLAAGHQSWERPAIYSLDAWMTNGWQDARFRLPNAPSLLSPLQERELWRQVIEQDRSDLFDLRAMASLAQRASRILAEYQIPTEGPAWTEHADAQEFLSWHHTFHGRLKEENWITRSDLWRLLPVWIEKGVVNPGPVAFVALAATSPGLKRLSRALGDSVQNIGIAYSNQPEIAEAISFDSTSQEIEYVARSVRYLLESRKTHSIAILVAEFQKQAKELHRVLNKVLYPSSPLANHLHIQTGRWIDNPVISNAILILELVQPRIQQASAGAILRCPYVDGAREERSLRAMADHKLRRARELDFSEYEVEKAAWDCPILYQVLRKIFNIKKKLTPKMRLPTWSSAFGDILEVAKWPVLDRISEAEQRAVDRWNNALSELASLGLVRPPVTLDQALLHLRSILGQASETGDWSSQVHILDAASWEGIEFDHTFVMNVSDENWPPPVALSPLIPYKLQRLHQVPASHVETVMDERSRKTAALFASAPCVQITFAGSLAPALRPYIRTEATNNSNIWSGAIASQSYLPAELDCLDDNRAPMLPPSEILRGGAGIIKSQSLCPFKAFAEYRLNARGDDEASIGFDALERGECAHKALEYIWRELGTQQNLKALPMADLQLLVEKHIEQAVQDDAGNGPIRLLTSLAERDRLVAVILQWLSVEKERSKPFIVERLEEKREVDLAGLKLSLRMDRVDRLPNGGLVLIDYKSGQQSVKKLEGARPQEPQLLVYAAVMDEPIDGIYFGELKNRKARPVGHGVEKHFPKQRNVQEHQNDWAEFLAASKANVFRLAEEFKNGDAAVAPLNGACSYCRVKPICRVGAESETEDDEA